MLIVCPELTERKYPGAEWYQEGGIMDADGHIREKEERTFSAADRIVARKGYRLGGVVDDKVNAGERFKGADIASLAADDTTLHFVVRNSNDGYCGFRHGVCCKSGDGKGDVLSRDLVLLVLELLLVGGDLYSLFVSQLAV